VRDVALVMACRIRYLERFGYPEEGTQMTVNQASQGSDRKA
jgi:hypothetical protein